MTSFTRRDPNHGSGGKPVGSGGGGHDAPLAQPPLERLDAPGVLVEVLMADDPSPPRADDHGHPVAVEQLAVGCERAGVEAGPAGPRPRRAAPPAVDELALQPGRGEVLQEALDGRLAAVLAGPAVV